MMLDIRMLRWAVKHFTLLKWHGGVVLHHTKENHKEKNTRKDAVGGKRDERKSGETVARGGTVRGIA